MLVDMLVGKLVVPTSMLVGMLVDKLVVPESMLVGILVDKLTGPKLMLVDKLMVPESMLVDMLVDKLVEPSSGCMKGCMPRHMEWHKLPPQLADMAMVPILAPGTHRTSPRL